MKNIVKNLFERYNLDFASKKAVVAVSTGVDSMVLLRLLEELDLDLVVCHVNHKRRKASDTEEEFIKKYCEERNIKLYIKSLEDYDFSNRNFQEEAREIRLEFFKEICSKENASYLFLGHHLNDDIETFFLKLFRGSSIVALSGIKEMYKDKDIFILRPLLRSSKDEILEFARNNNIIYFEDESNSKDDYTRNRIRHNIIPEVYLEEPTFNKKFIEFKEILDYSSKVISNIVDEAIKNIITIKDNGFSFNKEEFLELDLIIQKEVLFTLLFDYKFSKKNIEELLKYVNSTRSNLIVNYKDIHFIKEYNIISIAHDNYYESNNYVLIDQIGEYKIDDKHTIYVTKKNNVFLANNSKIWYNSKDLPVVVRRYAAGDNISLGFGTKKVSRILIDNKIPITQRKNTFVLVKDKLILGVFNHARSIHLTPKEECDIVITLKENENDY